MAEAGTQETAIKTTEKQRSLGIWILTLYALVFAGLMPLVIEILLIFSAVVRNSEGISIINVLAIVALSLAIIIFQLEPGRETTAHESFSCSL